MSSKFILTSTLNSRTSILFISVFLGLIFFSCNIQYINAYRYVGCFQDTMPSTASTLPRDIGDQLFLEEAMTLEFCETSCGQINRQYFGVQYGMECWCGNKYGTLGQVDESRCNRPCGGKPTEKCGGDLVNSVYEVDETKRTTEGGMYDRVKDITEAERDEIMNPVLVLVMIVKNEAHTLPSTLLPLRPYLDYYYILDTGSTDGTQDAIRRTLGNRGEIWEEPFIDYGTSRNRALEIAQNSPKNPVFSLMLSADETVYNAASLRKFCDENRNQFGEAHEAYAVVMDVGWKFDSLRLSRTNKGWRYVGRVHEYLAAPDQKWHPTTRVPNSYIKFRVTDPERRSQREYKILEILLDEKGKKPHDTRTSFYLARTYNVIGNHSAALDEFRRRVSLGGWQEEVYESLYAIAWQLDSLRRPWSEQLEAFLDAYEHSPERAEPLYSIASHYYKERKYYLAYLYAYHASTLTYPTKAVLWVQAAVYEWQCHFLVGMTANRFGSQYLAIGARSLLIAMSKRPGDSVMEDQLKIYRKEFNDRDWQRLRHEVDPVNFPLPDSDVATDVPNTPFRSNVNINPHAAPTIVTNEYNSNVDNNSSQGMGFGGAFLLAMSIVFFVGGIAILLMFCRHGKVFRAADGSLTDKIV